MLFVMNGFYILKKRMHQNSDTFSFVNFPLTLLPKFMLHETCTLSVYRQLAV